MTQFLLPLLGGALIGLSATVMLLFNGRITGISGILNGSLKSQSTDLKKNSWRYSFLFGLILGGALLAMLSPSLLKNELEQSMILTSIGGLLVGIGTLMGSGCTSGHGVCGISRLSPRSIVATLCFMGTGILTVYFLQHIFELRGSL